MTSKLQRMIDLEIEADLYSDGILDSEKQRELDHLRKEIETNLPKEFTEHRKEYEPNDLS